MPSAPLSADTVIGRVPGPAAYSIAKQQPPIRLCQDRLRAAGVPKHDRLGSSGQVRLTYGGKRFTAVDGIADDAFSARQESDRLEAFRTRDSIPVTDEIEGDRYVIGRDRVRQLEEVRRPRSQVGNPRCDVRVEAPNINAEDSGTRIREAPQ